MAELSAAYRRSGCGGALHRLPVRKTAAVGEEQDLGERTGRNRRPPTALRVAVGEVPVADDPLTVLGEQTVKGIARHHVAAPARVEQPLLGRVGYRQHPPPPRVALSATLGHQPDDSPRTFFSGLCGNYDSRSFW